MKNLQLSLREFLGSRLLTVVCAAMAALTPNLIQAQAIEWKVKNPFRFIDYSKPETKHWTMKRGVSAFDFVDQLMADGDRKKLPPFEHTRYIRNDQGTKPMLFSPEYIFPKHVWVKAWLSPKQEGDCEWQYGGKSGKFKCDQPFEFGAITHLNEGPSTLTVTNVTERKLLAATQVVVKDRLVLGLGDSFGSGEGNPDKPAEADADKLNRLADKHKNSTINGRWMGHKSKDAWANWVKSEAEWLDKPCHRSLFSQHVLAAMRLAAENPKESVTLVPLACSGAEVLDGVLTPQNEPPGGGGPVATSQVNLAIMHLCDSGRTEEQGAIFHRGSSGSDALKPVEQKLRRCLGKVREPDAILLSIGGNDVGFSAAIAWAALPYKGRLGRLLTGSVEKKFPPVCPSDWTGKRCGTNLPPARYRISTWLPHYYQYLMDELSFSGLVTDPRKIFLTAYPDPTYKKGGTQFCDEVESADALEQIRTLLPWYARPRSWDLRFTEAEIKELRDNMIVPLAHAMEDATRKHKWTFVNKYLEEIRKDHGLCADYARKPEDRPSYPHVAKRDWHPKSPELEWAYDTSRQRWFRNTNDSILFQFDAKDGSIKGAFHPDFRAHARMADEVSGAVRAHWIEHTQNSERK